MLNRFFKLIKKVIMSTVLLYTYNKFAISFDAIIPINFITIFLVTIFGIPVIIYLVLFLLIFL